MSGSLAAPGATYSQGAGIAPTSPNTKAARARMDRRDASDKRRAASKVSAAAAADDDAGGGAE